MKCSNCGKDIPFVGNVCPHCKVNKQGDQVQHFALVFGAILGAIIGFVGLTAVGVESFGIKLGVMAAVTVVFGIYGAKAKASIDSKK